MACQYCMTSAVGRCQYCGPQGAATVAHDWDQLQQQLDALSAEVERLRDRADRSGRALTDVYSHLSAATARAEAADGRAAGLYRALCDTVTASGGIAREGLSDEFLILGVPAEMAARKKAQEAAERERDEAQAHARHWREAAVTENERAMEYLNAVAEAQAHAAELRGALDLARVQFDWIRQNSLELPLVWQAAANANADTTAAIQRMPAQSLVKIQAKAIRAACLSIGTKKQYTANEVVEIMREKADRLEVGA